MSEQNNEPGAQGSGGSTGYSADYVKQLREEAATWRTKYREVEEKVNQIEADRSKEKRTLGIQEEFAKRGIQGVNPSWVEIPEGMTPDIAVEKFLKDYPSFLKEEKPEGRPRAPYNKPMIPHGENTNIENTAKSELNAIKKDPVAREKLRHLYRGMLATSSKSSYTI